MSTTTTSTTTTTTTTPDKWVIHRNGHLKRIDTKDYTNAQYVYQLKDGTLTMTAIDPYVKTTSFKDASDAVINPSNGPFLPVASNDGFVRWPMPTSYDSVYGFSTTEDGKGYQSVPITGSNAIQFVLGGNYVPTTGITMYAYNATLSRWQNIGLLNGASFLYNTGGAITSMELNGENVMKYAFNCTSKTDNVLIQYNKGAINKIAVPSTSGNYNLKVDAKGNVTFTQGEVVSKLAETYRISINVIAEDFDGSNFVLAGNGAGIYAFDKVPQLIKGAKYFVEAKFWFRVDDSSIFDDTTTTTIFTFKIEEGDDNIIGRQILYHPENGILELRFSGVSGPMPSTQPSYYLTTSGAFNDLGVTLKYADRDYVGEITVIEI